MSDWYESSFGDDYMVVYRHRNWDQAIAEVRLLLEWLELPLGSRMLDVGCGMGRHAVALDEMGYRGIDLSLPLLKEARSHDAHHYISWQQGDMRELPYPDNAFDATVNLFTSFGYFSDEDNKQVLRELRRVLRSGGVFVIDYLNASEVKRTLVPWSEREDEQTGWIIREHRTIELDVVCKTISIITPSGEERHYEERVKLYRLDWFEKALAEAGLRISRIAGQYDGTSYNESESKRLIISGRAD
ncbi:methyltransferase family protein [Paenibacillus cellulosilyticus]|uniref:Methyltransferase family protein n=1 Tax=Paenibacillus cellulosilyticus TaxID=375489 RepID=A0A2V2YJX6_9BACL|nr:class I SAM-dependent methyltransferase [Paenibacillus cellulosilyticus]PWV92058.1 methyltransferase family protein [Paenibacillus cellulosilyticus]QKS46739.1 class I SAM-dependent methyltransferase [Paenibacillus cellulosilyticus]